MHPKTENQIILAAIERKRESARHFRMRAQELRHGKRADAEHIANVSRMAENLEHEVAALQEVLWEIESNIPFVTHQGGTR